MSTLKLDSGYVAVAIAKAIKPAISTDKLKRHLLMVELRQEGERIRIAATDGYRLHAVYVTGAGDLAEPVTLVGAELVKALALAGKDAKAAPVSIFIKDDGQGNATVDGVNVSAHVPGYESEFPNVSFLFSEEPQNELGAAMDGHFLADMATAAQHVADIGGAKASQPIVMESVSIRKPLRIASTSQDRSVQFTGLLMPQRIS
jgi:hypothetical protein